jgi:linalool 8-monooxygenase
MGSIENGFPDLKDPDLYVGEVPHAVFTRLRREAPVHWNPEVNGAGFWAVTRYNDIVAVLGKPDIFSSARENGGHRIFNENEVGLTNSGEAAIGTPFISQDPPVNTLYRRTLMPSLTPNRLEDIEARINTRVADLLAQVPNNQPVDIVPLLSAPLPLLTLTELLGLPGEMWQQLYHWTNAFVGEDDPDFRQSPSALAATMSEFLAFGRELFAQRRANPGKDIASLLANARIGDDPVSEADFIGNLILVLVGGNETTRNSLSHSIAAFAAFPDEWQRLRADPSLMKTAVREMVRYATPVMHMRRTAMVDTEIGGQKIAKGDKVVTWFAAANRDEAEFADPDRFDITRSNIRHLGFGTGQHSCVGFRLAEMQLRVAFEHLLKRAAGFEIVSRPKRFRSNFINGLKDLNVVLLT